MSIVSALRTQIPVRLWLRHWTHVHRYSSHTKVWNAIRALWHYWNGHTCVDAMPLFLKVELSRYCTVHCPNCPCTWEECFYPTSSFKSLVDAFGRYVFMAQLYEVGEPLLHPDLLECIRYAHDNGVGTVISTTLSVEKPDSYWGNLVASGLDRLIVAIDGLTEAVYNRYRTHGRLDLAMGNLSKILTVRKQQANRLCIEWQMIDFPWNRCEQAAAKRQAKTLGCDVFRTIPDASVRHQYRESDAVRNTNCIWPYVLLLVNAYGNVLPCFKPGCSPGTIGNLNQCTFQEVWNGEEIQQIRSARLIRSRKGCSTCSE